MLVPEPNKLLLIDHVAEELFEFTVKLAVVGAVTSTVALAVGFAPPTFEIHLML